MANVVMKMVPVVAHKRVYRLLLEEKEAIALRLILDRIGGDARYTARKHTDDIARGLDQFLPARLWEGLAIVRPEDALYFHAEVPDSEPEVR